MDAIKNYAPSNCVTAHKSESVAEKLVNLSDLDRIGVIEDYANVVKFYHPETGQKMGHNLKIES